LVSARDDRRIGLRLPDSSLQVFPIIFSFLALN
jgi:hypothetical protein